MDGRFTLWDEQLYSLNRGLGGFRRRYEHLGGQKTILFLPEFEPQIVQSVAVAPTNLPQFLYVICKGKGKAILLQPCVQALRVPGGPTHRSPLPLGNIPGTHFC
jgi:hypothetical protein